MNIVGQFGYYQFTTSFKINTLSLKIGTNGVNQQCLIYYYYLSNMTGTQHIIQIRKEETDGGVVIIDSVNSSSFNGWNERRVSFNSARVGYKVLSTLYLFLWLFILFCLIFRYSLNLKEKLELYYNLL